uniref:Kinesin motor domain-containing protein n=1 Tax=Vitis vinifera TaxID=29760 RepID=F6HG87_VITVI
MNAGEIETLQVEDYGEYVAFSTKCTPRPWGQAKTLMFVHISPEPDADGETISTVKFAERFATVELDAARVNKDSADVKELKEQIGTLKAALARKKENQRTFNIHFPTVLKDREQKPVSYHLFIVTSRLEIC